jgi:predicted PurR-regulated permease PerM
MHTQRTLRWAIFLGAAALIVYLCLRILGQFVNVIAWASVLAITFHPLHASLVRRTDRVALSAAIASALVVIAFMIPLLFLAGVAINQLLTLGNSLQQRLSDPSTIDMTSPFGRVYEWVTRRIALDTPAIVEWVRQNASELTRVVAQYSVTIAASVTGAVMSFIFIIFAMFLLFRDGDQIVGKIPDLLPFERTRSEKLLRRVREVIHGSVYGVVVIALVQGTLCGGMFWILGIPSAALWAMVTVLTSVLPLFGAAAVWAPGAVYLGLNGEWTKAIVLAVWGGLVISSVDNFLRPRLVGGRVGLSELVMFFSVLGGLQVFGLLGIVLGPVLFAIAAAIVDVLSDRSALAPAEIVEIPASDSAES